MELMKCKHRLFRDHLFFVEIKKENRSIESAFFRVISKFFFNDTLLYHVNKTSCFDCISNNIF